MEGAAAPREIVTCTPNPPHAGEPERKGRSIIIMPARVMRSMPQPGQGPALAGRAVRYEAVGEVDKPLLELLELACISLAASR